jgi:hypothetical protein
MTAGAVLVCHPDPRIAGGAEFTFWANAAEARQAEVELTPCGNRCSGRHSVARVDLEPDPRRWLSSKARA